MAISGFKALRKIEISSTLRNVACFLQRLPPDNRVEDLEVEWFHGRDDDTSSSEENTTQIQFFINAVHRHMNPVALQNLDVDVDLDQNYDEPLELTRVTANLSPLFIFKELRGVQLSFMDGIWLTQEQTEAIPTAWPNIQCFRLHNDYDSSRIPRVNHTHLLQLAYRCRELRSLGFPFDASQINGNPPHTRRFRCASFTNLVCRQFAHRIAK
jgi:hypothetical protein